MEKKDLLTTIREETRGYLEEQNAAALEGIRAEIAELRKPKDEEQPKVLDAARDAAKVPAGSALRTRTPYQAVYDRMSEREREWRSPDSDHWAAEWLRGACSNDRARMGLAIDGIMEVYGCSRIEAHGLERADTLVGDPTAGIYDGTGGVFIPLPLAQAALIARENNAIMRSLVTNLTMGTGPLRIPTVSTMAATMQTEQNAATSDEPTNSSVVLTAKKMRTMADISMEALADSDTNIISVYATRAGMAMAATEDVQICSSNGTAPNFTGKILGTEYVEATITNLVWADVLGIMNAIGDNYISRAVWLVNSAALAYVQGVVVPGSSVPAFMSQLEPPRGVGVNRAPARGTFMGHPLYVVPMADGVIWFGDPAGYYLGTRSGIEFSSTDALGFATDTISTKWIQRLDGATVDGGATAMREMRGIDSN